MIYTLPESDLRQILEHTADLWKELRHERIFISGGTGFFGAWLVESFLYANEALKLGAQATILTRRPEDYRRRVPGIAEHPSIQLCKGDIRDFSFPAGTYSFIIHAANESLAQIISRNPEKEHFEIQTKGTERILEFAVQSKCKKLLFTSSGAVYGRQAPELSHMPEDFRLIDQNSVTVYGERKRIAEDLCISAASKNGFEAKITRCFCFIGPYLPLDQHFAAGNFIRDALDVGVIHINGDGTPFRSYLYTSDLAIWLWTILFRGENCRPYNVGSDQAISILELANIILNRAGNTCSIIIDKEADPHTPPQRYVPDVSRAQSELGLLQRIELDEAVDKSLDWYKKL